MKKEYNEPKLELIILVDTDFIVTSTLGETEDGDNEEEW